MGSFLYSLAGWAILAFVVWCLWNGWWVVGLVYVGLVIVKVSASMAQDRRNWENVYRSG